MAVIVRSAEAAPEVQEQEPRPAHRSLTVALAVAAGVALAVAWSFKLVDTGIGDHVAKGLLGTDAKQTAISGSVMGAVFALVSGMAGTFTACNIAAFGALAPLVGEQRSVRNKIAEALKPMGWLLLGACAVSGAYGALVSIVGPRIPQLSKGTLGPNHFPVRLVQSSITFGVIGLVMVYLGLIALKMVPNPLAGVYERHARAPFVLMGCLIGAFVIGRPFALFQKMLAYSVSHRNPLYGAVTLVLQSVGNVVLLAALFVLLSVGTGGRLQRWLVAKPGRAATITAVSFILFGLFFITYWDVRLPSMFHYGWFPTMPWNA